MNSIDLIPAETQLTMHAPRTDTTSAKIIDQSLGVQACYGTFHAARLLRTKDIPIHIALRVLLRTSPQRPLSANAPLQLRHYGLGRALAYSHTSTW